MKEEDVVFAPKGAKTSSTTKTSAAAVDEDAVKPLSAATKALSKINTGIRTIKEEKIAPSRTAEIKGEPAAAGDSVKSKFAATVSERAAIQQLITTSDDFGGVTPEHIPEEGYPGNFPDR